MDENEISKICISHEKPEHCRLHKRESFREFIWR